MKQTKGKQLTNRDFFFCYSPHLSKFLSSKGHKYIVIAVNPKSKQTYSMYLKSDELSNSINEYREIKN